MKLSHKRMNHLIRSLTVMVLMTLSVMVFAGQAFATNGVHTFASPGTASGGFKPVGNHFFVSDKFEPDTPPNDTAIWYNNVGATDEKTVTGMIIKADGTNLTSFNLTDMKFTIYAGASSAEDISSLKITGTKVGGGTVSVTVNPPSTAAGASFTLLGIGADLSTFTDITQLAFDITTDNGVYNIDFATITLANEIYPTIDPPTTQASNVQGAVAGSTELNLGWTSGNGGSRVVFAKAGATSGAPVLSDSTTYAANANFSLATDPDSDGWKCVYNGNSNFAAITGLNATTQYRFVVFEYNGSSGNEKYLTTSPGALNQTTTTGSLGVWTMGDIQTLNAENFWTWTDTGRDNSGNSYVSHRYSGTDMEMRVEKWDGASWSTLPSFTPVPAGYSNFNNDSSLAVPPGTSNQVRVALYSVVGGGTSWGITEAAYNGSAWSFRNADYTSTAGYTYSTPVIAVGGNGYSHILYEVIHSPVQEIRLASWNGSAWGIQTLSSISGSGSTNEVKRDYLLLIDSSNIPHVFYFRETSANIRDLHHWSNGADTVITTGIGDAPYRLHGAVDSSGKFHITYAVQPFTGYKLMYLTDSTGAWITQPLMVSTAGDRTGYIPLELRINASGDMVIPLRFNADSPYSGITANNAFKVLLKKGTDPWQLSTLSPLAPDWEDAGFSFNSAGATFLDNGKVLIAYANELTDRPRYLKYAVVSLTPPVVTGINPTSGPLAGGTPVTITGTGFDNGATVTIGGAAATGVTWNSATSISATTPSGTAGAKNVVVTNPDTQTGTLTNGFTYIANTAPAFVGATTTLTVNQNAGATDITGLLHASDTDASQTETWTQSGVPSHGTLSFASATATSGTADITPGGNITYTPTPGYSGSDSFTVQVSDGIATATRTITVTVVPPPTATTGSASSISATGATLNGTVNDNGASTTVTFDYGTTTGYGTNTAATTGGTITAGSGSTAVSIVLSGLTCNTTYNFRVKGVNSAGTTNGSDAMFTTSKCPQSITFNNPGTQNFGTTPTLTATSDSGLTPTFTSSTTGVCAITSGGALTFVMAGTCTINAEQGGDSTYSAASTVSRSFTVNAVAPGTPTIGTATAGDTQASIAFSAPASNGGASITSYTATSNPGGLTGTCASSPCTMTGLTNGTAYTFTVTATNSAGTGSASAASNSVTPAAAQTITFNNPGAQNFGTTPTLTATASSGLTVSFTSSTTGVCTVTAGGALTFVTTGTCTINADQAGNGSFIAAPTVTQSFAVAAVVPGAPTIGTATAGDTQASVAFTAPVSNGGASITGYTVTSNPGGLTSSGASSPITVTGLTNGTAYTFTVTAHNSAGTGSASSASNSVTPNPGPTVVSVSAPANGSYKAGSNLDFTVNWDSAATVTGTPRIALVIGSATVYATYQSGSGTASTLFRYTVLPGQTDTDGITVGALSLNGGTIRNSSGTDATLTLNSVASTVNVLVDTTAPTLSSIATSNPTHSGGTLTATANENALGSWIAVSSGATAPTVAQVLAGADYGGVTVVAHGSGALSAGNAVSFSLSGLVAATSYDIYLAAQDAAGNPSAAVSSATLITATTRLVTTASDSGPGSLRQTIADANPGDIILFDPSLNGQTVTLASPLVIAKDLSLGGYDARPITISGGGTTQIFQVSGSTTFTLNYLTLTDGVATDGGAISDNVNATTFISLCTFSGNTATAAGGAISAAGTMIISGTLFAGNSAVQGGAIFSNNALSLVNVTMANNNANSGGGIYSSGGSALVKNTTIAGNNATVQGGGIEIASGAVGIRNSIVAGNTSPSGPDIFGIVTSLGYNLVKDTSGATFTVTTGELTGQDPLLGPLADNGGPIKTMALLLGSPAIDSGACTGAPATDQRSMPRPQNGLCDMGAYERGVPAALTAIGGTPQSAAINAAFATPLKAKVTDSLGGVMDGISVTYTGPASGAGITADGTADTAASGVAAYGVTANGTAGSYTVTATVSSLTANFSLTNNKLDQSITFTPPATATYGDAPIILAATGGLSGNPVTFAVTSGPGSLTGNVLTITGTGPIVVTASQAGNANYNAATSIQKTIAVGKATATIALTPASLVATYDGTAKAAAATTTPSGLSVNFTYDGSSTVPIAAGSYSVVASISDTNYQGGATGALSIGKGSQSITFGTVPTVVVGGSGTVSATASSGLTVAFSSTTPTVCTVSGATVTAVTAGTCTITADQAGNANYVAAATLSQNLTVVYSAIPPVLTVSTLADGSITNNAVLNVSGQATSINGITSVTVNGAAVTLAADGTFSQAVTLQAGTNTVTTIATDNAGTTTSDSRSVTLDTTAPVITITAPADNGTLAAASVTVTGTVDKSATVQATVNNGSAQSAAMDGTSFSVILNLAEGINTITISATDLAGNSTSAKRTITSDTTKPTLAITDPAQDITTGQASLTISGTVTDALTDVSVTITCDGKSYTPQVANGAFQQQITFTTAKQYAITVTATDQAGNSVTTQRNVIYALSLLPSGDINNDGKVDIADALLALRAAVGIVTPDQAQLAAGDVAPLVNGKPAPDGVIDIADAMLILEKAVGILTW